MTRGPRPNRYPTMRFLRQTTPLVAAGAAILGLFACQDPLTVVNENNPDVARAFSTATGIEQVIATTYQQIFVAQSGSGDAITPQAQNYALESYGSVANFGMAVRVAIPRFPIDNGRNNAVFVGNFRDYNRYGLIARSSADGVRALDALVAAGGSLGSIGQNARARAFGFFTNALALGYSAMVYDSTAIIDPSVPSGTVPSFSDAATVMTRSLALLDSAIAIANGVPAAQVGNFTLPSSWIIGNALTRDQFVRVARSHKARFRAGVARDTVQRAAVDWNQVIADAQNGIDADLVLQLSTAAGWTHSWLNQFMVYQGWHQVSSFYIGMADTSGAYQGWLNTPLTTRSYILIQTPDRRFPAGATRAAQTAVYSVDNAPPPAGLYFRNRPPGQDTPGDPWGNSFYDHVRFRAYRLASANGPWPAMTKAEMDLLRAEGLIRTGNVAAAIPLINATRTANGGLPAIPAGAARTDPVPGGAACVPRVPVLSGSTYTTACGNVLEALKWEKRLETQMTGYIQWFIDGRGWGDLIQNTPTEWPVPYQEMDARSKPFYNSQRAAVRGTYGF